MTHAWRVLATAVLLLSASANARTSLRAASPHEVVLAGAPNFRDLGGIATRDGRHVKDGLLYRSDQMDKLTAADIAELAELKVSAVIDLRTDPEIAGGYDRIPMGTRGLHYDVLGGAGAPDVLFAKISKDGAEAVSIDLYRSMVSSPQSSAAYSQFLATLNDTQGPVVYHCTAGKDRTGWGTAIVLSLLGVPRETIIADYLESNRRLVNKNAAMLAAMPEQMRGQFAPMLGVRREWIEAGFAEVDRRYGSVEVYARQALGMDAQSIAALRKRLLTR